MSSLLLIVLICAVYAAVNATASMRDAANRPLRHAVSTCLLLAALGLFILAHHSTPAILTGILAAYKALTLAFCLERRRLRRRFGALGI